MKLLVTFIILNLLNVFFNGITFTNIGAIIAATIVFVILKDKLEDLIIFHFILKHLNKDNTIKISIVSIMSFALVDLIAFFVTLTVLPGITIALPTGFWIALLSIITIGFILASSVLMFESSDKILSFLNSERN